MILNTKIFSIFSFNTFFFLIENVASTTSNSKQCYSTYSNISLFLYHLIFNHFHEFFVFSGNMLRSFLLANAIDNCCRYHFSNYLNNLSHFFVKLNRLYFWSKELIYIPRKLTHIYHLTK